MRNTNNPDAHAEIQIIITEIQIILMHRRQHTNYSIGSTNNFNVQKRAYKLFHKKYKQFCCPEAKVQQIIMQ